jgi:hypothetical protein
MHARAKCEANALPTAPRPRLQSRSEFDIFYIKGIVVKIDHFYDRTVSPSKLYPIGKISAATLKPSSPLERIISTS